MNGRATTQLLGLQNAHLEPWDLSDEAELQRFSAQVVEPQDIPLIAYPRRGRRNQWR